MSKQPLDPTTAAAVSTLVGNANGNANNDDLQRQLIKAVLERLALDSAKEQKLEQTEAERRAEQEKLRQQQLNAVRGQMKLRENMQERCSHLKPNFTSNLNGQRDHSGHLHLVCSNCNKEF